MTDIIELKGKDKETIAKEIAGTISNLLRFSGIKKSPKEIEDIITRSEVKVILPKINIFKKADEIVYETTTTTTTTETTTTTTSPGLQNLSIKLRLTR